MGGEEVCSATPGQARRKRQELTKLREGISGALPSLRNMSSQRLQFYIFDEIVCGHGEIWIQMAQAPCPGRQDSRSSDCAHSSHNFCRPPPRTPHIILNTQAIATSLVLPLLDSDVITPATLGLAALMIPSALTTSSSTLGLGEDF